MNNYIKKNITGRMSHGEFLLSEPPVSAKPLYDLPEVVEYAKIYIGKHDARKVETVTGNKDATFLRHILGEIDFLISECEGVDAEDLMKDQILSRACVRSLEIIGGCMRLIVFGTRRRYPSPPRMLDDLIPAAPLP